MQKIRYWYWMTEAWLARHTAQLIFSGIVILLLSAISFGLYYYTTSTKTNNVNLVEGVVGPLIRTKLPPTVMNYISKGLVKINDKGEPIPELAESVINSDNGKTFTLKLKQGIKWHDGKDLTSKDLAYNIPDVVVEKPDDYTIIFKLHDPFAPFPTLLTSPLIKVTSNNDFYGVGDYYVVGSAIKDSEYITMLELESQTRSPKKITIKFYSTEQDALTALKLGEIHSLEVSNISALANWKNLTIYQKNTKKSFVGIFFNMKDNLVGGKDPSIRHALAMATQIPENTEPFLGPFSKYSWAYTPYEAKYPYNLDKAKDALNKWKTQTGNPTPSVTLSYRPGYSTLAEKIQSSWQSLGIETKIDIHGENQSFQTLLTTQDLPADPDQYNLWHSTQTTTNITGYNNVRADRDLEEARRTTDKDKRLEKYLDLQKILLEEQPVIYLYHPSTFTVILKKYDSQALRQLKGIE